ncbi:hypothetical protein LINPERHAP1_LOCUS14735 [Linum perenne]
MVRPSFNRRIHLLSDVVPSTIYKHCSSPKGVYTLMQTISEPRRELLEVYGLDCFVGVNVTEIDSVVLAWLLKQYDYDAHAIILPNGKKKRLGVSDYQSVYSIPAGQINVPVVSSLPQEDFKPFADQFNLVIYHSGYTVKSIKDALFQSDISDTDWLALFFLFIVGCLLAPNIYHNVDIRFLSFVRGENLEKFKTYNWAKFGLMTFKTGMVLSKANLTIAADVHFLTLIYLVSARELKGRGDSNFVLHYFSNETVRDYMEDSVAQYCALNNIAIFVNDDGIIITKGINDAAKGDAVSKKGKKKVVVEDIDHLDQQKGKKGAVKHQKGVSFADLPKKGSKKAVSKKRVRSEDEDEDVDESANLKKQRSVVSLPSPEINFSDLSSLSEAHELRSIFVEARSKCVDMIPAYDLVIGDIDAYFKSLASVGTTSVGNKPLNQQQLDEVIEVDDNLTKDKSQGDEDAAGADIVTDVEDVAGGNKVDATEDVVGVDKATSAAVSDGDSAPGSVFVEDPVTDGVIVHAIVEKPVPDDGGKEKDAGAEKIIQDLPIDQEEDDDDDQDKDDTNSNAKGSGEDSGDDDDDNSGAGGGLRVNDSVKGSTTNDDSSEADRGVNEPPPTKDSTHTQDGKEPESNDAVGANAFCNFVALSSLSKEEQIALQDVVASITYDDDKNV